MNLINRDVLLGSHLSLIHKSYCSQGAWNDVYLLTKGHPGLTDPISTPLLLVHYSSELFCPLLAAYPVTQYPFNSTRRTPPCASISQSTYRSLSHSFFVSHTLSSCRAPMVTCGPSKQDKLSTHKSQQCACPLSLAHPAWQQKPHQRLPPPAHSNVSHLVWSHRLLCKSTVFLTSPASHTLSKTRTLVKVVLWCWMIVPFIVSSL